MAGIHGAHYEAAAYRGEEISSSSDEHARIMAIKQAIPAGVREILDCGCGDGRLGRQLMGEYLVHGCDIASTALRHCPFPTTQCSLAAMPFADRAFDLVIASEVLEHILPGEFAEACREMERVARRWLLITVPNREDLAFARRKCRHCGTIFHDAWHIRQLDEKSLAGALPGFEAKRVFYPGHKIRRDIVLRRKLTNKILGYPQLPANRQCPLCLCFGTSSGRPPEPDEKRQLELARLPRRPEWYQALRSWALKVVPGRSRWLGMLLERRAP